MKEVHAEPTVPLFIIVGGEEIIYSPSTSVHDESTARFSQILQSWSTRSFDTWL
jgi:hypothetical protein